jgi:hypothetical protein
LGAGAAPKNVRAAILANPHTVCRQPADDLDIATDVFDLWLAALTPDAISRRVGLPLATVHALIEPRLAMQLARIAQRTATL